MIQKKKVTSDLLNNLKSWDDRTINVDEDWVKINCAGKYKISKLICKK